MAVIIQATVRQADAKIGVVISSRVVDCNDTTRHAVVTADSWAEIAEFIEGDEYLNEIQILWDFSEQS
jgi:hypothetical protein